MKIVWQVQAEIELDAAIDYYHLQASTAVATDFRNEVERVIKLLCKHTKLGAQFGHGARRLILTGYPLDLIYRETQDSIIIVALAHQRRRPGYWAGRRQGV